MTKGSRSFLSYLRAYLDERPAERRRELIAFYQAKTGDELHRGNLARYLALKNEPGMDATIVFINFLWQAGELKRGKKDGAAFTYARPEILK